MNILSRIRRHAILLLASLHAVTALDKICSCAPLVYRWTLDFSSTCHYSSISNPTGSIGISVGPDQGIKEAVCAIINPEKQMTGDAVIPVKVKGYVWVEIGQQDQEIKVITSPDDTELIDGDTLEFPSEFLSNPLETPKGLTVYLFAENEFGEEIDFQWLVRYSNSCDVPTFVAGDSMGWMIFSDASDPPEDATCGSSNRIIPSSTEPTEANASNDLQNAVKAKKTKAKKMKVKKSKQPKKVAKKVKKSKNS